MFISLSMFGKSSAIIAVNGYFLSLSLSLLLEKKYGFVSFFSHVSHKSHVCAELL